MVFEVSRREVLNNLIRFKDNIAEMQGEKEGEERDEAEQEKEQRKYRVLLNRKTGDMRFAQRISALEQHIGRKGGKKESLEDWKEIQIVVQQHTDNGKAYFELRDAQNHTLKPSEIEPLAWRVTSETLDVLNHKAEHVVGRHAGKLPEEVILHDLSSIQISTAKSGIEEVPGWRGSLSRIQAEEMLEGQPEGTYLLREGDEMTLSISFHFAEENLLDIHPFLLTVVEKEGKISDILMIQTNRGWTLYHDDPNLNDSLLYRYFPSLQAMLQSLDQMAKLPLPLDRSNK